MGPERVRCDGCDFAWFGPSAAHGLAIIGRCPRCGSALTFTEEADALPAASEAAGLDVPPSRVLGRPVKWA